MRKITLITLMTSLFFTGCCVTEYHLFRSYINTYYSYNDISADLTDGGNIRIYGDSFNQHYKWNSKGEAKVKYDSLCTQNNDISYNTKRGYIGGPEWGGANAENIRSIQVVSNADFDEAHPQGASLNDVIRLISVSPKKFIDSSYQSTYDWKTNSPEAFKYEPTLDNFGSSGGRLDYHPIEKKLSDITPEDMLLAGFETDCFAYLIFEAEPTVAKTHELTITIHTNNGKTFSPTLIKIFE